MKPVLLALIVSLFPLSTFGWVVSLESDKMTDEKWHYLTAKSLNNVWGKKKADLVIAHNCNKDITRIYISHPFLVGSGPVEVRLDELPKESEYASASASKKVLFIGDESSSLGSISAGHPKNLIKKWEAHKKLLIQYEAINKTKEIAHFNITGLNRELEKFCK